MDYREALLAALRHAGELAIRLQSHVVCSKKSDGSIVTSADFTVTEAIRNSVKNFLTKPSSVMIDEESWETTPARKPPNFAEYTWVMDPIGGSFCYANQMPLWGIYIGILKNRSPWMGGVYLPSLRELYFAEGDFAFTVSNPFSISELWRPLTALNHNRFDLTPFFGHPSDRKIWVRHPVGYLLASVARRDSSQ